MDTKEIKRLKKKIRENLDLTGVTIPEEIKISTMTMDAKLDVKFNVQNIYRYIRKSKDSIVRIKKIKAQPQKEKKVTKLKKRKNVTEFDKKSKKSSIKFLNQVTVFVRVSQKPADRPVSVKIFGNGTLHYTGVINIASLIEATQKICEECKRKRAIFVEKKDSKGNIIRKVKTITFADDPSKLTVSGLHDFAVTMINCNFGVPFRVDRPKLLVSLTSDAYNASFDSNGHSAVKVKYAIKNPESFSKGIRIREEDDLGKNEKRVTIFVFESGKIIIILGNQGFRPINEVYTFIYKYLLENYDIIVKDDELTDSSIREYLEESEYKDKVDVPKGNPNSTAYIPGKVYEYNKPIDKSARKSTKKPTKKPVKKSASRKKTNSQNNKTKKAAPKKKPVKKQLKVKNRCSDDQTKVGGPRKIKIN